MYFFSNSSNDLRSACKADLWKYVVTTLLHITEKGDTREEEGG